MAKILLVEDDKSLREIYGVRLMAEGYEIVSAGDGEEALAMAIKERPDLIVSDVMMPKISGFDMLDILRSTTETKDVKVIMMTALSSEDQRARGESLGADRYLVKSQVGIEDVVRTVHEVLGDSIAPAAPAPQFGGPVATAAPITTDTPLQMPVQAPVAPQPVQADLSNIAPQADIVTDPTIPRSMAPIPEPQGLITIPEPALVAGIDEAPQQLIPAPEPAPTLQPMAQPPTQPAQAQVPTPEIIPAAFSTPIPPAPTQADAATAAPVSPTPAPVATQPAVPVNSVIEAPASNLPQPTAPFSSPAPASLGERVITPLASESTESPQAGPVDLATQMAQALGQVDATPQQPLVAPQPLQAAQTPQFQPPQVPPQQ